jgi:hypothetical protein
MGTALPMPQRTEGRAIAALVLGILGFVAFPVAPSVLAIWLGMSAKRRIQADPSLTGEGLATAGVILGIVELVLVTLAFAAFMLVIAVFEHSSPGLVTP